MRYAGGCRESGGSPAIRPGGPSRPALVPPSTARRARDGSASGGAVYVSRRMPGRGTGRYGRGRREIAPRSARHVRAGQPRPGPRSRRRPGPRTPLRQLASRRTGLDHVHPRAGRRAAPVVRRAGGPSAACGPGSRVRWSPPRAGPPAVSGDAAGRLACPRAAAAERLGAAFVALAVAASRAPCRCGGSLGSAERRRRPASRGARCGAGRGGVDGRLDSTSARASRPGSGHRPMMAHRRARCGVRAAALAAPHAVFAVVTARSRADRLTATLKRQRS